MDMTTKRNNIKKRSKINNLEKPPVWNLSDLYSSTDSKKILIDLEFIKNSSKKFEKEYERI